ncbi:Endonuclease/exonuclease/phosphatase [Trema orientale]|uniref:Endonuclease/exonuclease/phosphatase n=1 Tax=Trema orientale TaxID=63057 RepID=A0A2P5EZH5_TREOI|nr:Endonuclease/exonuclease/phosphatase [Trema orientale]
MVHQFQLDVLVLSELMIKEDRVRARLRQLHFYNLCLAPAIGRSGGLCIAWRDGVDLEPHFQSRNLISCIVYSDPPGSPWCFSAVYGPPMVAARRSFWIMSPRPLGPTLEAPLPPRQH